ncbi:HAMP domain-containing protein [Paenibacillus sp. SGZ-1009]|uniref:HAMP domain-containing protein n=1 Tax=Paenibacillus campi TaxID=3106031 RepID=UPI002AFF8544|nr:adenylate/guanylate cyclase domain-containing protein [Paenibacillus sp. SGZ-1009]
MKLWRSWGVMVLLLVALCVCAIFSYHNIHLLSESLLTRTVALADVNNAATDDHGNTYILDKQQRVIKLNSEGKVTLIVDAHENWLKRTLLPNTSDEFVQLSMIKVDDEGNMYIARNYYSRDRTELRKEEIVRYAPDGTPSDTPLYTLPHDPPLLHTYNKLTSMLVKNGVLRFAIITDSGLTLHEINLSTLAGRDLLQVVIPSNIGVQNVTGWANGKIFFTGKDGLVYRAGVLGDSATKTSLLQRLPLLTVPQSSDKQAEFNYNYRLFLSPDDKLYVTDIGTERIVRYAGATSEPVDQLKPTIWLDDKMLAQRGYPLHLDDISAMAIGQANRITIGVGDTMIQANPDLTSFTVINNPAMSGSLVFKITMIWICTFLIWIIFALLLHHIYVYVMKRHVSIMIKQMAAFLLVLTCLLAFFAHHIMEVSVQQLKDQIQQQLKSAVEISRGNIDGDLLLAIESPEDYGKPVFEKLAQMNRKLLPKDETALYSELYIYWEGRLYVMTDYGDPVGPYFPQPLDQQFREALQGETVRNDDTDPQGSWLSAVGPIYDSNGQIIGLHEVGMSEEYLNKEKDALYNKMFWLIVISAPLTALLFSVLTALILSSIGKLRAGAIEMAAGHLGTRVHIGGIRDEVSELGDQFNTMAAQIEQQINNMKLLSQSYYRFVPRSFLDFLDKKDLTEVQLGNQVEKEMSMMICSIRSFYRYTKGMDPSQIFNLINLFLGSAGPRIRHAGGIVNDYADASLFSLFPRWTEDALEAALSIRQRINEVNTDNAERGERQIDIGVVIHRGSLLLGVVGEEERMSNAVISEDVNVVFEMENISQQLGVYILLTDEVYQALEHPQRYGIRDLGYIQSGADDDHVRHLYELYDGDPEQQRLLKQRTTAIFEEGIQLYRDGRFLEARALFLQIIRQNGSDQAARLYFYLSDTYYSGGTDEDWKGQLKIS